MNGSQRKLKRVAGKHVPTKHKKRAISRMDVSFPDDSNDSGLGTELLSQITKSRDSLLLDAFDNSSSDGIDKDSSIDSLDSGIFAQSCPEDSCSLMETLPHLEIGCNLLEESNLAHFLCHAASITEDFNPTNVSTNESLDEPPSKRLCLTVEPIQNAEPAKKEDYNKTNQTSIRGKQIDLLGIAPENERPNVVASKSSNNNLSSNSNCNTVSSRRKANRKLLPSLHVTYPSQFKDGDVELRILSQPEEQHRARYMTEGSRGAVKDRIGTGFPTVKLFGYYQPVTLQVFIGTDQGKVQPHLFYQACKVSGKNCTPCTERVIDGTAVIEILMQPDKDMTVSCDCIGILKERNVDVEQRLPYFSMTRAKKKNTRCRMVFRVHVPVSDVTLETLQVASCPILCTQPPGIPEISKKSLKECSVYGGKELFIIGKNFLKDTKVVFQDGNADDNDVDPSWQEFVEPEKEFLHQTHLVCRVPPYHNQTAMEPSKVQLLVQSGGKTSEPHTFIYLPIHQGNAVENSGKLQQTNINRLGGSDLDSHLPYRNAIPTIIQIPGMTSNGLAALVVAQQPDGVITIPGRTSASPLGNGAHQNFNKISRHLPKFSKICHRGIENYHVGAMQNEKVCKKAGFVVPQALNGLRHRNCNYIGKRISNRYHSKGKHSHGKLLDMRTKIVSARQATTQNVNVVHGQNVPLLNETSVPIFKQENDNKISEVALFSNIASADVSINSTAGQSQFFSVQVKPQVDAIADIEQAGLFESQNIAPMEPVIKKVEESSVFIDQSVLSEPSNGLVDMEQSPLFSPTLASATHLQVQSMSTEVLATSKSHSDTLVDVNAESLENHVNLIPMPQQANGLSVQLTEVPTNVLPILSPPVAPATILTSQMPSSVSDVLINTPLCSSDIISSAVITPSATMNLRSASLCVDAAAESRMCAPLPQTNDVQNSCIQSDVIVSPFTCSLKQHLQENMEPTSPTQSLSLSTSESIQPTRLSLAIQSNVMSTSESENSIHSSNLEAGKCLSAAGNESLDCKVPSLQSCPALHLVSEQPNCKVTAETPMTTVQGLSEPSNQTPSLPVNLSLIPLQMTSSLALVRDASMLEKVSASLRNSILNSLAGKSANLCVPPNAVATVSVPVSSGTVGVKPLVLEVKQEKNGDPCEMTTFQNCMTTALSQLSEADLLQFINPSTFDNV